MTGFMTLKEIAEKWRIGARRINTLCVEGRIEGSKTLGNMWIILSDFEKFKDEKIESKKYIRNK